MDEILQKQSDILSILPDRKYLQRENAFPVIPATEVREHSWTYHAETEMLPFSQHRKIAYPIAIPIVFQVLFLRHSQIAKIRAYKQHWIFKDASTDIQHLRQSCTMRRMNQSLSSQVSY